MAGRLGGPLRLSLIALASAATLLAALAGLVLATVLAALTALTTLATLMLLAGPVLSALSALAALAAALLRTLLLVVTLRVVLLVRHWEILRCLFGNAPPRRNVINARQKLKRRKPVTTDTVNEL